MVKIGIPEYNDVVNAETLETLKNELNTMCLGYKQFANQTAINNRESDLFEQYKEQYEIDIETLSQIRNSAMHIFDNCNSALFAMTGRAISQHIFQYGVPGDVPTDI